MSHLVSRTDRFDKGGRGNIPGRRISPGTHCASPPHPAGPRASLPRHGWPLSLTTPHHTTPHHTTPHHTTPHHTIVGCLQTPIDGDTPFSRTWEPPSHSRLGGTMPDGPGPIFPCGTLLSLLQCHCYNVRHYNIQVFRSCFCANAF